MKHRNAYSLLLLVLVVMLVNSCGPTQQKTESTTKQDTVVYLPSWNEGTSKKAIIDFVTKTTTEGSADFIPVADRIACFDNDGTLWSEQPMYFQLAFACFKIWPLALAPLIRPTLMSFKSNSAPQVAA